MGLWHLNFEKATSAHVQKLNFSIFFPFQTSFGIFSYHVACGRGLHYILVCIVKPYVS